MMMTRAIYRTDADNDAVDSVMVMMLMKMTRDCMEEGFALSIGR